MTTGFFPVFFETNDFTSVIILLFMLSKFISLEVELASSVCT